jgi:peroxiredoxin
MKLLAAMLCSFVAAIFLLQAAVVPRPSPELAFTLADGRQDLLSNYRGKVVALEFLLTTCPHCQDTSRGLEKLYREYAARGFQPIGVAINTDPIMSQRALAEDYRKRFGLTFPVGYASNDVAITFLQHPIMQRLLMPQLAFIDRTRVIQAQHSGDDPFFQAGVQEKNIRAMVEKLLGSPGSAKKSAPAKKK